MDIKNLGQLSNDLVITVKLITNSKLTDAQHDLLGKNGLEIIKVVDEFVDVKSNVDNLSKLFGTTINSYHNVTSEKKYFSHSNFTIPSQLNFVSDVIGLSTKPIARTYYKLGQNDKEIDIDASKPLANLTSFTPLQIAYLYSFPQYTGSGQTIAIIELGGGYVQQDLTKYFQSLGLGSGPSVTSVSVDGARNNPADTSGANVEVVLDIEVAGAVAPQSKIVVYFAPNTLSGFYDAIHAAIYDTVHKPSIISISWGDAEIYWATSTMSSYDQLFAVAVQKGINVFVAAGDGGASDSVNDGKKHVDFPSSSGNVIACGGTRLTSNGQYIQSEVVWNDGTNGGSTGGGFSTYFNKPSYQNGITAIGAKRGVPDLAMDASPYSGYKIYMNGQYLVVGGTSAVAPLMAGLIARINQSKGSSIGYINPKLYQNKPCVDIISGNNSGYSAAPGWDACTGWGRVMGNLAITKL